MSADSSSVVEAEKQRPTSGFRAGLLSILTVLGIYQLLPFVTLLILFIYPKLANWSLERFSNWLTDSTVAQFLYVLITELLTIGVIYLVIRRFRWSLASIGLKKPKWIDPLIGVATAVPYFVTYLAVAVVASLLISGLDTDQAQQIGFDSVQGNLELTLTFISLVILPPIVEEITMRGFLYTGLKKWLPRIWAALVVSVLFGAAHLAQGGEAGPLWIGAIDTFILSLFLVWLREKTGNLWAGVALHMTKNFVAFLALFVFAAR